MSAHQSACRRSRRSRMSQATLVALRPVESPWFCRRLGLLDSDQGLVGPLCIVERGFELGGWDVAEVAV